MGKTARGGQLALLPAAGGLCPRDAGQQPGFRPGQTGGGEMDPFGGAEEPSLLPDQGETLVGAEDSYKARWPIEVYFRDCRQSLGLDRYRFTTPEKIEEHLVLVVVVYNFRQEMGQGANMSIGQLKRLAQGRPAKPRRPRVSTPWFTKLAS